MHQSLSWRSTQPALTAAVWSDKASKSGSMWEAEDRETQKLSGERVTTGAETIGGFLGARLKLVNRLVTFQRKN